MSTSIKYQFLQVVSAYTEGVLSNSYKVPGYIIFDKTRGTITVVNDSSTYTEYGGGIKSVTSSSDGEVFTFTDTFGNTLTLDLTQFASDKKVESLESTLNTYTETVEGLAQDVAQLEQDVLQRYTKNETDTQISNAIKSLGTVFNFKGVKDSYEDLPTTDIKAGDVWQVATSGTTTGGDDFPANTEFFYATYVLTSYQIHENSIFNQASVYVKDVVLDDGTVNRLIPLYNWDGTPLQVDSTRAYFLHSSTGTSTYVGYIVDKDREPLYDTSVTLSVGSNTDSASSWEILGTDTIGGLVSQEDMENYVNNRISSTLNYAEEGSEEEIPQFMKVSNGDGTYRWGFMTSYKKFSTSALSSSSTTTEVPNAKQVYDALCWHILE